MARIDGTENRDVLTGTLFDDLIFGLGGNDDLFGRTGDDRLNGGAGNDTLEGNDGSDILVGGTGNDKLIGGLDPDQLFGGAGDDLMDGGASPFDVVSYVDSTITSGVTVNLGLTVQQNTGGGGRDTITNVERLIGSNFADVLTGRLNDFNTLDGASGDDQLFGGTAGDKLIGGIGNDTLTAGDGLDTLEGGWGNDTLLGQANNDQLAGGTGNDRLTGGTGKDILSGGLGGDLFTYTDPGESGTGSLSRDEITDYNFSEGDRLDVSTIDADANTAGVNDAFTFIGSGAFTNVAGQLRFDRGLSRTDVLGDVDGDGNADFSFQINNRPVLFEGDFIL